MACNSPFKWRHWRRTASCPLAIRPIHACTTMKSLLAISALLAMSIANSAFTAEPQLKIGIIGLDTSHVTAFTKALNDPQATADLAGCKVVAAYPKGSPDIESST